jgi:hypothetical protein
LFDEVNVVYFLSLLNDQGIFRHAQEFSNCNDGQHPAKRIFSVAQAFEVFHEIIFECKLLNQIIPAIPLHGFRTYLYISRFFICFDCKRARNVESSKNVRKMPKYFTFFQHREQHLILTFIFCFFHDWRVIPKGFLAFQWTLAIIILV